MPKKRWIENEHLDATHLDIITWPIVHVDKLDPKDRKVFLKRKKAVELYMKNERTLREISEETGIDRKKIRNFVKRCLSFDENSNIWGFRALIPGKRIKTYQRKSLPSAMKRDNIKLTGSFRLFLQTYPEIKETIDTLYLGRNKREIRSPIIKVKDLHAKFLDACRSCGISHNEYPFITEDLARRSLYRYVRKLEQQYFGEAAKRYGEEMAKKARYTGKGQANVPMIVRPLERVQFDGHRIDASIAIIFQTPEGDEIVEIMDRLWLLVIIDVATRVVLSYHVSYNKEYSASDVLHCIKNAVIPRIHKPLTIPGLTYSEQGGFASEKIPEMHWAVWDECHFDNGKANLAHLVKDRLNRIVGCAINAGPVALPMRRSYIERFFKTLEENGYHRLPNTTGSSLKDPRRQRPERAAVKYRISSEHLEQITDVLIANYNGTPHEGINNLTPLECLQQRISRGMLPRVMPEEKREEVAFLSLSAQRKVQGNIKKGRRPFVNYEGVEYRNEVLSRSLNLIGTKLDLLVNIDDIRVIRAFLPDGSELGRLTATGKWGVTPHSLQVRRQINKLRKLKLLHFTHKDDPINQYLLYLQEEAKTKKTSRNRLKSLERNQNEYASKESIYDDAMEYKDQPTEELKPISKQGTIHDLQRKPFKTITY